MSYPKNRLVMVGCNHDRTPLDIREKIALTKDQVDTLIKTLGESTNISEVMILNTCNRIEIYIVTNSESAEVLISTELCKLNKFEVTAFKKYAYSYKDCQSIMHLFRVSSGLDSQLIGETEIFGQVKDAYQLSNKHKTAGKIIHRVLQKTFHVGKWARTHTGIGIGNVSIGNIAVNLASRIFGNLNNSRMLVVGSGDVGKDVAKAFRNRGIGNLSIASRTIENAQALANEVSGIAIPFNNWTSEINHTDIVVFTTSAQNHILTAKSLIEYISKNKGRPLFLIDLALPRDVDPSCAELENVYLYNLDDLEVIAKENLEARKSQIEICENELKDKAEALYNYINS